MSITHVHRGSFGFTFEEISDRKNTWSSYLHQFRELGLHVKCLPSNGTKTQSCSRRNKNAFSNFSALVWTGPGGRFSKAPETFRARKAITKSSNLAVTGLFYSHILKMKGVSLHTRSFRRIHFSVFRYWWSKNGFSDPKSFRRFRKTGPRSGFVQWTKNYNYMWVHWSTWRITCLNTGRSPLPIRYHTLFDATVPFLLACQKNPHSHIANVLF